MPFGESSPILNDVSGVPNWDKVSQGMYKMFNVEVLGKLPVIKHLKFGSILGFKPWKLILFSQFEFSAIFYYYS